MKRKTQSLIAVVAIVAMVGFYSIFGQTTTTTSPPSGAASISIPTGSVVFANPVPTTSGIENVYLMERKANSYENIDNFCAHENIIEYNDNDAVITASGATVSVPYENRFDIIVSIKVDSDNVATLGEENVMVELALSGAFTLAAENSQDNNEFERYFEGSENLFINVLWDNNGEGYILSAGATLTVDSVKLFLWK